MVLYQTNGANCLLGMCLSTVLEIGNSYLYRGDILNLMGIIQSKYGLFLSNLDSLQSHTGGVSDAYVPDFSVLDSLSITVYNTLQYLNDVATNSKKEIIFSLSKPTNVILLAYQLYGLQQDDSTIDFLIKTNNIGLKEMLLLPVGGEIRYYI